MKKFILLCAALMVTWKLPAQSNAPVRLALIAESPEASAAADVLTAELSRNPKLHLLERNEIEKIYREQGLSAANQDYLKLGRILGADGLLLFEVARTKQETNLVMRLIAVKPGVVLLEENYFWPLPDLAGWGTVCANHIDPFLAKLTVLVKDAIPISVVNLRSAMPSAAAAEIERQLKLLTIQRLSREPQLFVLERQRLQLLSEEKELKADESAFWSGSYLLEGVIDQNGYSANRLTISARLTPPKGGTPVLLEASGSRTNFSEAINQLGTRIMETLKLNTTASEWNAVEEAAQYFNEAKWALKWEAYDEAQTAAESAWVLGKHDLDGAVLRVKVYLVEPDYNRIQRGSMRMTYVNPSREMAASRPPTLRDAERARRALELYLDYSRTLPVDSLKPDSVWYRLGLEDVMTASRVLQHFYLVPAAQPAAVEKLRELRSAVRSVAGWLTQLPAARDHYVVGNGRLAPQEVKQFFTATNIFSYTLNWGPFWQEKPEDSVAVYRVLMQSPRFVGIHGDFWFRAPNCPRLVGWNAGDERRIPSIWQRFQDELNASTNDFFRMEGKALTFAELRTDEAMSNLKLDPVVEKASVEKAVELARAERDRKLEVACEALFSFLTNRYDSLVAADEQLLSLDWGLGLFFYRSGIVSPMTEELTQRFRTNYGPHLAALRDAHLSRINERLKAEENRAAFEAQKRYLAEKTPYNFSEFNRVFALRDYSPAQAEELESLVALYKSNLLAQASSQSVNEAGRARGNSRWIETYLEQRLQAVLHPALPPAATQPMPGNGSPPAAATAGSAQPYHAAAGSIRAAPAEVATNIVRVQSYWRVPIERLEVENLSRLAVAAHRGSEGKLLLGLSYQGNFQNSQLVSQAAGAIFDFQTKSWEMIRYPRESVEAVSLVTGPGQFMPGRSERNYYFEIFRGQFYLSDAGEVRKFDLKSQAWTTLNLPGHKDTQFFTVNGRLFAANEECIFEITDDGTGTHLLASTRRRPAVSALDSLESLGRPVLFAGPGDSLRAGVNKTIFRWDGHDWREEFSLDMSEPPELWDGMAILRSLSSSDASRLWTLQRDKPAPELGLYEIPRPPPNVAARSVHRTEGPPAQTLWKAPAGEFLVTSPAVVAGSNLYFFVNHSAFTNISGRVSVVAQNGYHARLICLSSDFAEPIVVPLKFDEQQGPPPISPNSRNFGPRMNSSWMWAAGDALVMGQVSDAGIWMIPIGEIETAVARQKQRLLAQAAAKKVSDEQGREKLLTKYDRNHNGVFDPDEKEEALSDAAFIESQLEAIDTNRNGILDLGELSWFDANTNRLLESNEEAGITAAWKALAEKDFAALDLNGDGALDASELSDFAAGRFSVNTFQKFNAAGFEEVLKQLTEEQLRRTNPRRGMPSFDPATGRMVSRSFLRDAVESHWNPGANSPAAYGIPARRPRPPPDQTGAPR